MLLASIIPVLFLLIQTSSAKDEAITGQTKSGKPCRIVTIWDYDGFLDVDTEAYRFETHKRIMSEFYEFHDVITFDAVEHSPPILGIYELTYITTCREKRSGMGYCSTRKEFHGFTETAFIVFIIIVIMFLTFSSWVFYTIIEALYKYHRFTQTVVVTVKDLADV